MARGKNRMGTEVNAGSMADIAFLLLIFFLVTTTIASDKGIAVLLPPKKENQDEVKINQRNIFNVQINSKDMLLVEEEPAELEDLKAKVKKFVMNNGRDPKSSESPAKAIVSLKTDRGTSYERYIALVDELKIAYNELRAEFLGISFQQYSDLDPKNEEEKDMLDRSRKEIPYQVSDAEPTDLSAFR